MWFIYCIFGFWVVFGIAILFVIGYAFVGTLGGVLEAVLWGGLVWIFLLHYVMWLINFVCYFWGIWCFEVDDHSINVFWLVLLLMGEAWHYNYYTFLCLVFYGLKVWEIDPIGWVIRGMCVTKLVWNVVEIMFECQW